MIARVYFPYPIADDRTFSFLKKKKEGKNIYIYLYMYKSFYRSSPLRDLIEDIFMLIPKLLR